MKRTIIPDYSVNLDFLQTQDAKEAPQWLRPALEFATPLLGLVLYLLGIANQHPVLSKVLLIAIIAAVALSSAKYIVEFGKWVVRKYSERRFAAREDEQLCTLVRRFDRFTSPNDGRALVSILRSLSLSNSQIKQIEQMANSYWIQAWIVSFGQQLAVPPRSSEEVLRRVREFGGLVATFNNSFVLTAQKELAPAPIQQHCITQLEVFREEFHAFLREIEQWCESLANSARMLKGAGGVDNRLSPLASFQRVPSFSHATTVLINGK